MKTSCTPFYDAIAALQTRGPRFFVPGHKGNPAALPPLAGLLRWDYTEVAGADDLAHPTGPLLESQRNMARVFGAGATLYSAAGTSACVQAMLALFCPPGSVVAIARGAHVSAVRALALLEITPFWVPLRDCRLYPGDAAAALQKSGAKVLFCTGTDYYGRTADIAALAACCRAAGAALLCDNAHGAHRRFLQPNTHPLHLGADAVCDSAHKTLFALTPAALLHLADAAQAEGARAALNLFSSTSPSYPVLLSLDLCAGRLLCGDGPDYPAAARRLAAVAAACAPGTVLPCDDALRLVLCPGAAGLDAAVFYRALLAAGAVPELYDGARLVWMASPFNTEEDYARLEAALAAALAAARAAPQAAPAQPALPGEALLAAPPPPAALSVRGALFAPRERVPVGRAVSRICAGLAAPCPPAVPLVIPGEEITAAAAAALTAGGISHIDVVK